MSLDEIFKDLVWDALVTAAVKALIAAVPWLGWGPLPILLGWLAGLLTDHLYIVLKDTVNLKLIILKNEEHAKEFAAAAFALKNSAITNGISSEAFKKKREEAREKMARFIQFA